MSEALALLPPVINQTIQRVPLSPWSAAGFVVVILASAYLGARRSPWVALALACAIPFAGYRDVAQTTLTISKCVVIGSAAGLLFSGISPWPRSPAARLLIIAGAALLLATAASSLDAKNLWYVAREFFKQAEYLVVLWCAVACIENIERSPRYLACGVLAATLIVATLAVSQAVIGGAPSGELVNGHALPRVAGTLEGPNQLAGFLEAALPVLWVWPLLGLRWMPLRGYALGASCAALILTQSRAGIVMAAAIYAILWRLQKATARSTLLPTLTGVTFGLALLAVWFTLWAHASWADIQRFFLLDVSTEPGGVGTRAQLWPAAIALFAQHPLFGIGAGNFALLLPSVGVVGVTTGASSLWLQTLAEQGIFGLAALAAFAAIALRETFRRSRQSALALAAFLATASLLAHQFFDDLFFFPKVAALFWLLLGAGVATRMDASPIEPSKVGSASGS